MRAGAYYPAMPSDTLFKLMNRTHRILIAASGGGAGRSFSGMPVLELTTTGRKSGQLRSTMLTSPYQDGGRTYIVASRGGENFNPAWFLNLRDNPEVTVSIQGGLAQKMHAEVADPDERARVWPLITSKHANYAGYQRKTQREIPLVVLTPTGS
jgi:deazaflavin-dependent oxidoreductase (nitroreductase family)